MAKSQTDTGLHFIIDLYQGREGRISFLKSDQPRYVYELFYTMHRYSLLNFVCHIWYHFSLGREKDGNQSDHVRQGNF